MTSCIIAFAMDELDPWFRVDFSPPSEAGVSSSPLVCVVSRTNEDARLRGVPFGGVDCGVVARLTVLVRTIGAAAEELPIGRIITSLPSKLNVESREFNSTSAVTGSLLTMTGYNASRIRRDQSDTRIKSRNSVDLE